MAQSRLSYMTIDRTNAAIIEALAEKHGLGLEMVEPRDLTRLEREETPIILDWDFVPADIRARLLNGSPAPVVAVHGYQIPDSVGSFLAQRRNIIVSRKLDNKFVRAVAGLEKAA